MGLPPKPPCGSQAFIATLLFQRSSGWRKEHLHHQSPPDPPLTFFTEGYWVCGRLACIIVFTLLFSSFAFFSSDHCSASVRRGQLATIRKCQTKSVVDNLHQSENVGLHGDHRSFPSLSSAWAVPGNIRAMADGSGSCLIVTLGARALHHSRHAKTRYR